MTFKREKALKDLALGSLPQFSKPSLLPIFIGILGALTLSSLILISFPELNTLSQTLISLSSIWLSFAFAYSLFRADPSDALKPFRPVRQLKPLKTFVGGVFIGFGLQLLLVLVGLLIIISFGFDPSQVSNLQSLPLDNATVPGNYFYLYALILIGAAIIAPLMEELFFRGVVLPVVAARLGPVFGVLISSVAFGVMHVQPTYESTIYMVILTSLAGGVFGFLRLKSGSLLLPIAAHIGFNSWALIITLLAATLL